MNMMNMNENSGLTLEQALNAGFCILTADNIIAGFLSRFPAPECKEQQGVVDAAKNWVKKVEDTRIVGDLFAVKVLKGFKN